MYQIFLFSILLNRSFNFSFSLITLLLRLKFFNYFKTEKKIIKTIQNKIGKNKILIISGGDSINKFWHEVNKYEFVALNSYNTFLRLTNEQQEQIKNKIVIYFQARFHRPLEISNYQNNVDNLISRLQPGTVVIYDAGRLINISKNKCDFINYKVYPEMNLIGGKFMHSTGALTLLDILIESGINEIHMLGVDLDFYKSEKQKSLYSFSYFFYTEFLLHFQMYKIKNKIENKKNTLVISLNPSNNFNLPSK